MPIRMIFHLILYTTTHISVKGGKAPYQDSANPRRTAHMWSSWEKNIHVYQLSAPSMLQFTSLRIEEENKSQGLYVVVYKHVR